VSRRLLAITTTVALAAVVVAAAPARGATISLRVDSSTDPAPLFDGSVTTLPHSVDGGDGSGPHPCSGPPGAVPAATATGALDDAMRSGGIAWRGNWDPSFRDFFIDRIGPYASAAPDHYWSLTVNGHFASGGCLARVEDGDTVHFTYGTLFGDPVAAPGESSGPAGPRGEGGTAAPGTGPRIRRIRGLARRATAYLRRNAEGVGAAWGKLALAVRGGHGPERAATELLAGRLDRLRADGSLEDDVNATAIAVLALESPHTARRAARWLASVQGPSGGFGFRPGMAPDVDTTGLAIWALAREELWPQTRRGAAFVRAAQAADGGFPSLSGGVSNSQSTGLALVALRVAGLGARVQSAAGRTALDFFSSLARPNGSIAYTATSNPTPIWTTGQALLGLTSKARLLGTDTLRRPDF
jgi:hypothetical protein